MLYISRVTLSNVRCFDHLDISFGPIGTPSGWTLFVGDNATGKSTLLRSIAMGLCDEASAAGLLKESDEGYIRRKYTKATIKIWLCDPESRNQQYWIRTEITRKKGRRGIFSDIVRQRTNPGREEFPWDQLFVSGYGAGRGVSGTGDISSYSAIDAVYNMFNYSEGLQNPELTIRRLMDPKSGSAFRAQEILRILRQATGTTDIKLTANGVRVGGTWGDGMPLRDLADGYKSSVLWIADLIGWALAFKPKLRGPKGMRGIVLVDELEQHLHARWQRTIVDDLRQVFPSLQFVVTTHSPLIASRIGEGSPEHERDGLYVLEARRDRGIRAHIHPFMRGWRMDQVLASRAFKYLIDDDPAIENMLREASDLASIEKRTTKEELRYRQLSAALQPILMSDGQTLFERELELSQYRMMRTRLHDIRNASRIHTERNT